MGLTPHEYYCMTRAEFFCKAQGYQNKQWRKWEHTRTMAYTTASTVPSKKRMPKITNWMPLPTDDLSNKLSNDRIKGMFDKLKERDAKLKTDKK